MTTIEVHITELRQIPEIPNYAWIAGLGGCRSMGIVMYLKKSWMTSCREITIGVD